jgi:hypothetical protein
MMRLLVALSAIALVASFLGACTEPQPTPTKHKGKGFHTPTPVPKGRDHGSAEDATPAPKKTAPEESQTKPLSPVPSAQAEGNLPYAKPVPGKPGFVCSPYNNKEGYIDVRGFPAGTEVKDPYSGKSFLTPDSSVRPQAELPQFPEHPPPASASTEIDRTLLVRDKGPTYLSDVDKRLSSAFASAGYAQRAYYAISNGFVMVSRLEQITAEGTPMLQHRWSSAPLPYTNFSVKAYLKALFTARQGHYRVICFRVSPDEAPTPRHQPLSDVEAASLVNGPTFLPNSYSNIEFTNDWHCVAYVYEFVRRSADDEPVCALPPDSLSIDEHLKGAGLWAALGMR